MPEERGAVVAQHLNAGSGHFAVQRTSMGTASKLRNVGQKDNMKRLICPFPETLRGFEAPVTAVTSRLRDRSVDTTTPRGR